MNVAMSADLTGQAANANVQYRLPAKNSIIDNASNKTALFSFLQDVHDQNIIAEEESEHYYIESGINRRENIRMAQLEWFYSCYIELLPFFWVLDRILDEEKLLLMPQLIEERKLLRANKIKEYEEEETLLLLYLEAALVNAQNFWLFPFFLCLLDFTKLILLLEQLPVTIMLKLEQQQYDLKLTLLCLPLFWFTWYLSNIHLVPAKYQDKPRLSQRRKRKLEKNFWHDNQYSPKNLRSTKATTPTALSDYFAEHQRQFSSEMAPTIYTFDTASSAIKLQQELEQIVNITQILHKIPENNTIISNFINMHNQYILQEIDDSLVRTKFL